MKMCRLSALCRVTVTGAQSGQAAILIVLSIAVLLACIALGVDGARLYAEGLRVQRAADEAALTSVVQGSINGAGAVTAAANDMVTRNLPLPVGATKTVQATYTSSPVGQVRVVVDEQHFPLLFAPIFGVKDAEITREATAQYNAPVPMGNPSNTLGYPTATINTYPVGGGTATPMQQNMKLSVNGPDQWSESGDPYSPLYVLSDPPAVTGGPVIPNPFRPGNFNGYDYKVTVPSGSTGYTYIQVYDAETCHGGPFNDNLLSGQYGLPYTSQQSTLGYPVSGYGPYPTYYRLYWQNDGTSVPSAYVKARGPGATPGLPPNVVIAPTEGIYGAGGSYACDARFTGKWYTLAVVDASQAGSYIVNVSTCLDPTNRSGSGYALPLCEGTEVNNFALRAITTNSSSSCASGTWPDCQTITANGSTPPQVAGVGRESIMVDCSSGCGSGNTTLIYLAKIDPIYRGKWLQIKLYDPGDLYGASSMQIVRPDGSYAPFEWYTETLDENGQTFQTALQHYGTGGTLGNMSLITSFPAASQPAYTSPSPVPGGCGALDTSGVTPPGAPAYGQTVAEDNPFDPIHLNAACVGANDYHAWPTSSSNTPPTPSWIPGSSAYQGYNLNQAGSNSNYRPFNGRWVYIFTQIPGNYDTTYNPSGNPNPGWWYVQYKTSSSASFTDRTVWEATVVDTPPHLTQ